MGNMNIFSLHMIFIFITIIMISFSYNVNGIDDKCSACNAIAEELERGMVNEKPRNHLDMRHRLDSKGQRQGKVIDYRASELRAVELLDGLCDKMQDYTLEKVDKGTNVWIKVNSFDDLKNKQEAKAYAKDISSFCGRLLEETEDDFTELIKKGSVEVGGVSNVLCKDLSKYCRQTSGHHNTNHGDDTENEL
ncbi:hypothetical protein Leryth_009516 [Lithospermum erythrorhizon]|nr:hypothetical protein Leryth_009516 [Lithospermum erythrorhizon]